MFSNILKHALIDKNMKVADLARLMNTTQANLSQKLKRNNFSEKEMAEIAEALGLTLEIRLV